jgi:hypothetical protein
MVECRFENLQKQNEIRRNGLKKGKSVSQKVDMDGEHKNPHLHEEKDPLLSSYFLLYFKISFI